MKKRPQYFLFIGIGILTMVVLVMIISPDFIFSPSATFIGGDPNKSSTNQVSVVTRTDFNNPDQTAAFPLAIGQWSGREYDAASYSAELKADVVLMRGYELAPGTQPLTLVVVQGNSESGIHEPHYCFPNIQEQAKEDLVIPGSNWPVGGSSVTIPLNKLVSLQKSADGTTMARRLVLYFYVKGNQLYSDRVALVEVQGLAPLEGSYAETLQKEKDFLSQVVPQMFSPGKQAEWRPVVLSLAGMGLSGYAIIVVLFALPAGLLFYPRIRRAGTSR